MDHLQVVGYSAFILALFSTPQTECQSCMPVESFRGMDFPQYHDLGWFGGMHHLEKWMSLAEPFATWWVAWWSFCPAHTSWISESMRPEEVAISWKVQERSWDPSWSTLGQSILKLHSLSSLDEVGVFSEGFPMTPLEQPCKGPPLFLPLAGMLFQSDI